MKITTANPLKDISAFQLRPGQFGIVTHHNTSSIVGKLIYCFKNYNDEYCLITIDSDANENWFNFEPDDNLHFRVRLVGQGEKITIEV